MLVLSLNNNNSQTQTQPKILVIENEELASVNEMNIQDV